MASSAPKTEAAAEPAINVSAAVQAASLVKATIHALTARRASLVEEQAALEARNVALWDMPLSRTEARAFVLSSVDIFAAEFPGGVAWNRLFKAFAYPAGVRQRRTDRPQGGVGRHGGPLSLADVERVADTPKVSGSKAAEGMRGLLDITELGLLGNGESASIERAICYFFPDQVKALMAGRFDAQYQELQFPNGQRKDVPTLDERRTEINANSERIAAIGVELTAVESQLAELGPGAR